MSIGINNPRYVMTAKDHVGYYRWARELEEKLQKQGELKHNDEPGLPPSDRGAFQPAQKAPGMEDERSHYSEHRRNYLTSKGINNPDYAMTARERVEYYQFARESEENLQKQRELERNDKPAPPPSGRGAFQPAQKAPRMEDELWEISKRRRKYLMSKGINNPHYEMTASDRVEYYQWAREMEEKLEKQRELKPNDEPAPPPSDRGACQPAQKAADVEGECSHQASCHQETTIEKTTQQIHEIMRECWEETEGTRHGKDLEVLRGHLRRVLFLKRKKPSGQPGLALASQEETCRAIGNVLELRHSYLERKGIEDPFHILMDAERDELIKCAKAEYEGSEEQRFLQSADAKKWKPKGKQSKRKGGKARGRDAPQLAQGTLSDFLLTQKKKRWRVHLEEVCGTKEIWEVLAFTGWFHSDSFLEVLRLSGQDRDAKEKPQIVHRQQRRDLHHARVKARADYTEGRASQPAWQQRVGTGVGWHGGASGRSGRLAHGWVPPPWRKVDIAQEVQDGGASQPAKSSDTPEASVTEDARILKN